MAKAGSEPAGTAGSQFFIITGKNTLTADYAYVGTVTKGLDVAKKIASFAPANGDGPPTKTVKINKVTVTITPKAASTTAAPTTTTAAP
jgi:peptidyl-prolyl cis-trans isomerase B (cyclophilin B)